MVDLSHIRLGMTGISADEQRAGAGMDHRCEGGFEFALACGFHAEKRRSTAAAIRNNL